MGNPTGVKARKKGGGTKAAIKREIRHRRAKRKGTYKKKK